MNRETAVRREMTPEVLDEALGTRLVETAMRCACGSRFTAPVAGLSLRYRPCEDIERRQLGKKYLQKDREACLLPVGTVDAEGLSTAVKKPQIV